MVLSLPYSPGNSRVASKAHLTSRDSVISVLYQTTTTKALAGNPFMLPFLFTLTIPTGFTVNPGRGALENIHRETKGDHSWLLTFP